MNSAAMVLQDGFTIIPMGLLMDKRLTLEQTRVLLALFSFRGRDTDTVWPSRDAIAERCGMHPANISKATSALVELGWIKKEGDGAFGKSSRYKLTTPKVAQSATPKVAQSATPKVAQSATPKVAQSATEKKPNRLPTPSPLGYQEVAQSARGKEHTKNIPIEHTEKHTRTACAIFPEVANRKLVEDWEALRKTKRAPITETAIAGIAREAKKAGLAVEAVLQMCCERGWAGFSAAWVAQKSGGAVQDARLDVTQQVMGKLGGKHHAKNGQIIDITPVRAIESHSAGASKNVALIR